MAKALGLLLLLAAFSVIALAFPTLAETRLVPQYPSVIDCSTSDDPLCKDGLPPGVEAYSEKEAFFQLKKCVKGNDQACYELCRRRLNGNSAHYSCPELINLNSFKPDVIITDHSFACNSLADEKRAEALDGKDDEDRSFNKWLKTKAGSCFMTHGDMPAKKLQEAPDEFYQVAVKGKSQRRVWVMGLFLKDD